MPGRANAIASQWMVWGVLANRMPVLSLLAGSRPGSRPTFLLLQDGRPRTGPHCPRPRSAAAGQPVSWHLRGAPQNSTSRRGRYARTTAASQITKWLCPAAQPPPRKHHATGAATRGGSRYHSRRRCARPVLQRFASCSDSPHLSERSAQREASYAVPPWLLCCAGLPVAQRRDTGLGAYSLGPCLYEQERTSPAGARPGQHARHRHAIGK